MWFNHGHYFLFLISECISVYLDFKLKFNVKHKHFFYEAKIHFHAFLGASSVIS